VDRLWLLHDLGWNRQQQRVAYTSWMPDSPCSHPWCSDHAFPRISQVSYPGLHPPHPTYRTQMAMRPRPRRRSPPNARQTARLRRHQRPIRASRIRPHPIPDLRRTLAKADNLPRPLPRLAQPPPHNPSNGNPSQLPDDRSISYPIF
jgi:hypothetical protein